MIEKFTSIKQTIAKVYRDLALEDESRWEDMIEWSAEALEQIGTFAQHVHKTEIIEVSSYKAAIPCTLVKVIGMETRNEALTYNSGTYDTAELATTSGTVRTMSHTGYTMNNAWFNFNFEKGEIRIAYLAIPTDDEGFPLIPDSVSFREAIEKYIVMKMMYPKFLTDSINPNTWDRIVNDWNWFCGQARGVGNMPNMDKMESIKNMWNRLKPEMNQHKTHFANLNNTTRITK